MRSNLGYLSFLLLGAALFSVGTARGSVLLNFSAVPISASTPELVFANSGAASSLKTGAGAVGNGDGNLPTSQQTVGGLELDTPLSITASNTAFGRQNNVNGTTTFYDVTLTLTGLTVSQTANNTFGLDVQPLASGTFAFYGSKAGGGLGALLLSGTLTGSLLDGVDGSATGGFLDSTVTYTGGAIYNRLVAQGGATTGNTSQSLTLIQNTLFGINDNHYLNSFQAHVSGAFDTANLPEPGGAICMLLALTPILARRSKRRPAQA